MLENFNHFISINSIHHSHWLVGFYTFRCIFAPRGLAAEFNTSEDSIYLVRVVGTFALSIFLIGIYILFRPNGPTGTWVFFNLIFLLGLFQALYDTTFYFKVIDNDIVAKNGLLDLVVGLFFVASSIILIIGLSDKIYAFS